MGWTGDAISGVDGKWLLDYFLADHEGDPRRDDSYDFTAKGLLKSSLGLGMDCSCFVFYHCDLGPGNIIAGPQDSVGIIDWETAGFVPKEWIRTKFRISSGMDLPFEDFAASLEWRKRVIDRLGKLGFGDVRKAWDSKKAGGPS